MAGLLMLAGTKAVGKRRAVPLALAGIVLYTLLVGADAAVVRAAIMGCLYVLALYFGRQTEVRTSLIFSALLMTAINPHTLWDVGFQLSFAATAGLIWVTAPLERVAERWLTALVGAQHVRRAMGLLSEALLVTLAAQIATEPLIVYHFGRMSAVSLLTNLLILPVQPMVMMAGGLATMAGMIWLPLGQLLGWLAWLPLAWTVWVVGWTATVLKVPHHGGDTSSSQAFLEAVDPQVAVVSVGADNRFGHPAPEVLARYGEQGVPVLRTDELGTVEFVADGDRLWVQAEQ